MNRNPTACPSCHYSLSAEDAGGLCPICILQDALGEQETDGFGMEGYTVGGLLGAGGMGRVYRALQHSPQREVALKMLSPGHLFSPDLVQRFRNEAETVAALDHPGILPVYEVGEHAGMPFFTMKLAEGGTLSDRKASLQGQWRDIAGIVAKVASAVHYAHERGVLHRDLKPGNILFNANDSPCVSDFGLAKIAAEHADPAEALTKSLQILGTPAYLAPEIAAGSLKAATIASDVYALGAILYELLEGGAPYQADSIQAMLHKIIHQDPLPLLGRNPGIPRDLAAIAHKCLDRRVAGRYLSAQTLAADLQAWLEGGSVTARVPGAWEMTKRWVRKRPAVAGLSATLILSAILGTGLLWRNSIKLAQSRTESENLVEYMTEDLGRKLRGLGRLELLDETSERIERYFDAQPPGISEEYYQAKKARFLHWKASMLKNLGRYPEAAKAAEAAAAIFGSLRSDAPDSASLTIAHVDALSQQSMIAGEMRQMDAARSLAATAIEVAEIGYSRFAQMPQMHLAIIGAIAASGDAAFRNGDSAEAEILFVRGLALCEKHWPGDSPREWLSVREQLHYGRHVAAANSNNWALALDSARLRLQDAQSLLAADPRNAEWKENVAMAWELVGRGGEMMSEDATARQGYTEFYRLTGELTGADPLNTAWAFARAVACEDLAHWKAKKGEDLNAVEPLLQEFLQRMEALVAQPNARPYWKARRNVALAKLARESVRLGNADVAAKLWDRYLGILCTNLRNAGAKSSDADVFARTVQEAWQTRPAAKLAMLDLWLDQLAAPNQELVPGPITSALSQLRLQRAIAGGETANSGQVASDLRLAISLADSLKGQPGIPADSPLWKLREEAAAMLRAKDATQNTAD